MDRIIVLFSWKRNIKSLRERVTKEGKGLRFGYPRVVLSIVRPFGESHIRLHSCIVCFDEGCSSIVQAR